MPGPSMCTAGPRSRLEASPPCWRHVCMRPTPRVLAALFEAAFGLPLDENDCLPIILSSRQASGVSVSP
jgi:hypothetical protein